MRSTNNETPVERNRVQILQHYAPIAKILERISRGFIVKAGTKGSMQSLYLFLEEKKIDFGIRLSLENFSEMEKIKIIPLYAVGNLLRS